MFKCINSYCIPWSYVCDGKWDCPHGNDKENNPVCGNQIICNHMYKCKNTSHICLHVGNVCDGSEDCPLSDDEQLCNLLNIKCPSNCICFSLAVDGRYISINAIEIEVMSPYLSVHIINSMFKPIQAIILKLTESKIKDLQWNSVYLLEKNCFASLVYLESLALNNNQIKYIEMYSFNNLTNLTFLNLSGNPLVIFPQTFLTSPSKFKLMGLTGARVTDIDSNALLDLDINPFPTADRYISHFCFSQKFSF